MSPFTPLLIAGTFFQAQAQNQMGYAESRRQKALAQQYEQNAAFQELQGLQEHNARVSAFNSFITQANVARAANNRSTSDRSYQAILKASQRKSREELQRAKTQNLFAVSRQRFAASDAMSASALAIQTGRTQAFGTLLSGMFKISDVM